MMKSLSIKEIAEAVKSSCDIDEEITEVITNSREAAEGKLFVAIKGDKFDGHSFIQNALDSGCTAVISEQPMEDNRVIKVDNTKQALVDIAELYKSKFNVKTVGVTGSVGKTTTKDFIACVIDSKYKTLKSLGNENNEIGLPRTVFKLDDSYESAVFEMGMSNFGEISQLTKAVKPDVGVITNIGVCHIEFLKSRENILKAKMEICDGMEEGSPLIICGDDDLLGKVTSDKFKVIKYGIHNEENDVWGFDINEGENTTTFKVKVEEEVYRSEIPTIGIHNVLNALAAIAVGREFGIQIEESIVALKSYEPSGMRQRINTVNGITVIEDCYNASPTSVKAAMETFGRMNCEGRKIAVLGDMLELGEISKEAHREIGDILSQNDISEAFTYGEEMRNCTARAYELGVQSFNYDTREELLTELLSEVEIGDAIWVKGSHGMQLEKVIEGIYEALEKQTEM